MRIKNPRALPLDRHLAIAEQLRTMTAAFRELVRELFECRDLDRRHCPAKTADEILERLWELRLRLQGQMQREYPEEYAKTEIYYPLRATEFTRQRKLPLRPPEGTSAAPRKQSA